jgi:hypothetical protein
MTRKKGLNPNEGDQGDRDLCRELADEAKELERLVQTKGLVMEGKLRERVIEAIEAIQSALSVAVHGP